MSDHVLKTIEVLQVQIDGLEREISDKKRIVNSLCPLASLPPIYGDVAVVDSTSSIRSDEFYGRPLAEVVRSILQKRKAANLGAASVQEIYDGMVAGGYHFQAKNDDYAKRGLYQSLTKNTSTFHKLPNGRYGLLAWYPQVKAAKAAKPGVMISADLPGLDEVDAESIPADAEIEEENADDIGAAKPR